MANLPPINENQLARYLFDVYQACWKVRQPLPAGILAAWHNVELAEPPQGLCELANVFRDQPARYTRKVEELMRGLGNHITPGVRLGVLLPGNRGEKVVYSCTPIRVPLDEVYGRSLAYVLSGVYALYDMVEAAVKASGIGGWDCSRPWLTVNREGRDVVFTSWLCAWPPKKVGEAKEWVVQGFLPNNTIQYAHPGTPGERSEVCWYAGLEGAPLLTRAEADALCKLCGQGSVKRVTQKGGSRWIEAPSETAQAAAVETEAVHVPVPSTFLVIKYLCLDDPREDPVWLGSEPDGYVTTEDPDRAITYCGGGEAAEAKLKAWPEPPCLRGHRWVGVVVPPDEGWESRRQKDVWAVVWTNRRTGERRFMTVSDRRFMTVRDRPRHQIVGDTGDPAQCTRMVHADAQPLYAKTQLPPGVVVANRNDWNVDLIDIGLKPIKD